MTIRFLRTWHQWKPGAIVAGLPPGVASELVKRGTAEPYRRPKRERRSDATDRN